MKPSTGLPLDSGSNFYVFRTVDGGQTWSLAPPTDPYLKKVAKQTAVPNVEESNERNVRGRSIGGRPNGKGAAKTGRLLTRRTCGLTWIRAAAGPRTTDENRRNSARVGFLGRMDK